MLAVRLALLPLAAAASTDSYFSCPKGAYLDYRRRVRSAIELATCAERTTVYSRAHTPDTKPLPHAAPQAAP